MVRSSRHARSHCQRRNRAFAGGKHRKQGAHAADVHGARTAQPEQETVEGDSGPLETGFRQRDPDPQKQPTEQCAAAISAGSRGISKSEMLQTQMWQEIEALSAGEKPTVMLSLLIQSINKIFEVHEDRVTAGLHNRIPPSIWIALYVVLLLSMVGMGFHSGIKGSRSPVPSAALALSFSMVLFLIADLDRPSSGLVKPDQSTLIELGERLQKLED